MTKWNYKICWITVINKNLSEKKGNRSVVLSCVYKKPKTLRHSGERWLHLLYLYLSQASLNWSGGAERDLCVLKIEQPISEDVGRRLEDWHHPWRLYRSLHSSRSHCCMSLKDLALLRETLPVHYCHTHYKTSINTSNPSVPHFKEFNYKFRDERVKSLTWDPCWSQTTNLGTGKRSRMIICASSWGASKSCANALINKEIKWDM